MLRDPKENKVYRRSLPDKLAEVAVDILTANLTAAGLEEFSSGDRISAKAV